MVKSKINDKTLGWSSTYSLKVLDCQFINDQNRRKAIGNAERNYVLWNWSNESIHFHRYQIWHTLSFQCLWLRASVWSIYFLNILNQQHWNILLRKCHLFNHCSLIWTSRFVQINRFTHSNHLEPPERALHYPASASLVEGLVELWVHRLDSKPFWNWCAAYLPACQSKKLLRTSRWKPIGILGAPEQRKHSSSNDNGRSKQVQYCFIRA